MGFVKQSNGSERQSNHSVAMVLLITERQEERSLNINKDANWPHLWCIGNEKYFNEMNGILICD